jgi:hypothetical protein
MLRVHGQPHRKANIDIACSQKIGSGLILIEAAYMEEVMGLVEYVEEDFLIPIVMTDQCSTNSELLVSRHSLAGREVGVRCRRLDKLPVVG